jgi:hypothetical protein
VALRHVRVGALVWPTLTAAAVVVLAVAISRPAFRTGGRALASVAACLVVVQSGFLFFAGVGIASYSTPFFQVTPEIAKLQAAVGDALVGLNGGNTTNVRSFKDVGFYPNVNIGYSIRIFGIHDPLLPAAYFTSWPIQAAAPNARGVGLFVPDVNTVALAQRYGIAFVLTRAGIPVPKGMQTVGVLAGETLSKVPDAEQFSFVSAGSDKVLSATSDGNGTWRIATSGSTSGDLVFRVTALPGFRASIDNKSLRLETYDSVMMQAHVPVGAHEIVLQYLPRRLQIGVVIALVAFVALIGVGLFEILAKRRVGKRAVVEGAG